MYQKAIIIDIPKSSIEKRIIKKVPGFNQVESAQCVHETFYIDMNTAHCITVATIKC